MHVPYQSGTIIKDGSQTCTAKMLMLDITRASKTAAATVFVGLGSSSTHAVCIHSLWGTSNRLFGRLRNHVLWKASAITSKQRS